MTAWMVVAAVGVVTVACKAAGPLLLGSRAPGGRAGGVVTLVAPVMLVALVVTQTVGGDRSIVLDWRLAGVGAAAVALRLRVPIVGAMAVAALVTAILRHVA